MKLHVVIATRGRPELVAQLCQKLLQQSVAPASVTLVGASDADLAAVRALPSDAVPALHALCSPAPGATRQRNLGLQRVLEREAALGRQGRYAVVYLDDDFWPADNWLAACAEALQAHPDASGLTGRLLADGAHLSGGLGVQDAVDFLAGRRAPIPHWHGHQTPGTAGCAYGCNMVFVDHICERYRFDENLPLYSWQEDLDMSALAQRHGPILYAPHCVGVHLGVKSGRTSGLRFGYSQIANPVYLIRKGTMQRRRALRFVVRHLLSNSVRGLRRHPSIDYRGRLAGNALAAWDLITGRCDPRRIEGLK